ncbi:hypothetical protein [Methylobacterium oryzae]|uniref:hypothetical protein n=1 Tax=Methylobacterium oryzae TaxID=334852 RepID=UPI003AF60625
MTPTAADARSGLATALAAWKRLPVLAAALDARDAVYLVVDPSDARILHAPEAAADLAAALTGSTLAGLIHQIGTAAAGDEKPRLARLQMVTQYEFARAGIITEEMIYVAHRENVCRETMLAGAEAALADGQS